MHSDKRPYRYFNLPTQFSFQPLGGMCSLGKSLDKLQRLGVWRPYGCQQHRGGRSVSQHGVRPAVLRGWHPHPRPLPPGVLAAQDSPAPPPRCHLHCCHGDQWLSPSGRVRLNCILVSFVFHFKWPAIKFEPDRNKEPCYTLYFCVFQRRVSSHTGVWSCAGSPAVFWSSGSSFKTAGPEAAARLPVGYSGESVWQHSTSQSSYTLCKSSFSVFGPRKSFSQNHALLA